MAKQSKYLPLEHLDIHSVYCSKPIAKRFPQLLHLQQLVLLLLQMQLMWRRLIVLRFQVLQLKFIPITTIFVFCRMMMFLLPI